MATDVSNKTVLILVVLAVVVSTLGTFTVVHTVNQQQDTSSVPVVDGDSGARGEVSIGVNSPGDESSQITGQVFLDVVKPNNNDDGVR